MQKSFPRLHVFLGAGGVGKTTLSAGYALALASEGRRVGLLSIDPAKRLQSALGVGILREEGTRISLPQAESGGGRLDAALLHIGNSLRRWVIEQGLPAETQRKLFENAMFLALSEKLATSTDTFAAVRMAEWTEQFPDATDLVIDTAPGIHAIDFLAKPEKLALFLDSKLVEWLKWFVGEKDARANVWQRVVKSGARRILDGLAQVGGQTFLYNFGEFLVLLDEVFVTMLKRLDYARSWLRSGQATFVIVTGVREDAATVARDLGRTLQEMNLKASSVIVNRSFPPALLQNAGVQEFMTMAHESRSEPFYFANYLRNFAFTQRRVEEQMARLAHDVVALPVMPALDGITELRLVDLENLGRMIASFVRKGAGAAAGARL